MSRRLILCLLSLLLAALPPVPARPLAAASLLRNGSFEEGFHSQSGVSGELPDGWHAANLTNREVPIERSNPTYWSTCHFADAGSQCDDGWVEKIDGKNSLLIAAEDYYPRGLPYETVLYQTVNGVTPGEPYSFTGWVLLLFGGSAWPDRHGGRTVPPDPYSLGAWVGIDPTGGTDPRAATVEWSEAMWTNFHWENVRSATIAQASRITVFVRILHKWEESATTVILDGFNLQPAPRALLEPLPAYSPSPVELRWQGVLPPDLTALGDFALYYDIQRRSADGIWTVVAKDLDGESHAVAAADGERVTLRVLPKSWVPEGSARIYWPPSRFYGVPSAPVSTVVDSRPPTTWMVPGVSWVDPAPFEVRWFGDDPGSGVLDFDVQWRRPGGQWQNWLVETTRTSAFFGAQDQPTSLAGGDTFEFRVRARDHSGKRSVWPAAAQARSHVAGAWLAGRVIGNRGKPLLGVTLSATPFGYPDPPPPPGSSGHYRLPLPGTGTYEIAVGAAGVSLPPTTITVDQRERTVDWLIPPRDNAVRNGDFETDSAAWTGTKWSRAAPAASGSGAAQIQPGGEVSQVVSRTGPAQLALAWLYRGSDRNAVLAITHGQDEWRVPVGESPGGWNFWFQPARAGGSQRLRLRLEATAGTLSLDDVSLGSPQPDIRPSYLPLIEQR